MQIHRPNRREEERWERRRPLNHDLDHPNDFEYSFAAAVVAAVEVVAAAAAVTVTVDAAAVVTEQRPLLAAAAVVSFELVAVVGIAWTVEKLILAAQWIAASWERQP